MSFLLTTAASQFTYRLFDDGVSNILGLETLTHGTNPVSNVGIRINGVDPNWGGADEGSSLEAHFKPNLQNKFHTFKDSEIYKPTLNDLPEYIAKAPTLLKRRPLRYLAGFSAFLRLSNRVLPRYHAYHSGYNFAVAKVLPEKNPNLPVRILQVFIGTIGGLISLVISPTLRFRFAHINPPFRNDQYYDGMAYKTTQTISPLRIGLLGSLLTGINRDWMNRIKEKPSKAITGVVQLTAAVAIVALTANAVIAAPVLLTPIAIGIALA